MDFSLKKYNFDEVYGFVEKYPVQVRIIKSIKILLFHLSLNPCAHTRTAEIVQIS